MLLLLSIGAMCLTLPVHVIMAILFPFKTRFKTAACIFLRFLSLIWNRPLFWGKFINLGFICGCVWGVCGWGVWVGCVGLCVWGCRCVGCGVCVWVYVGVGVCVCGCSALHSKRGPESISYIQSEDILTKRGQNFSPRFVTMCTVLTLS